MTRRDFLGFFLVGGALGVLGKKIKGRVKPKKAKFWKKVHEK